MREHGPVPPTMFAVFRSAESDTGVRLAIQGEPFDKLRDAEAFARVVGGTCLVIKMVPVSVYRGGAVE